MRRGEAMRLVVGLATALVAAASCYDGDALEGAACESNADCWRDQTCVRTPTQNAREYEQGICRSDGECEVGRQLGCRCDFGRSATGSCENSLYPTDSSDPTTCLCCSVAESTAVLAPDGFLICVDPPMGTTGG